MEGAARQLPDLLAEVREIQKKLQEIEEKLKELKQQK